MDIRRLVGKNLRRLRLARGLTQEGLAHDADVAPSFLSQIENGKRSPTVTMLQTLADALGASVIEFFADAKTPTAPKPQSRTARLRR